MVYLGSAFRLCALSLSLMLVFVTYSVRAEPSDFPTYSADGSLRAPREFEQWIFVGSNLGLSYNESVATVTPRELKRAETPRFHNVYINRSSYDSFIKNKGFPNGTTLVMEVFEASDRDAKGLLGAGTFNGPHVGLEVAVKNSMRPDGSMTLWAYYDFTDPTNPAKTLNTAKAFPDAACEDCHHLHGQVDNVWVQFYPVLRSPE
jgi:hypothetical protein